MGWAIQATERLSAGEQVTVTPHGGSMRPRVMSGARVTLEPCTCRDVAVDDIVLCRVRGNVFLHLVKARQGDGRVLIGNSLGGVNGWTRAVYGRAVRVGDP